MAPIHPALLRVPPPGAALNDTVARGPNGLSRIENAATSKDARHSKPAADIVHAALEKAGVQARHVVMLGDTSYDIEAARRAGVQTVAVRYGATMRTPHLPALYRLAWWLPSALTVLAAILAVATLKPNDQGLLLMVAILPLILINFGPGFADYAALIVTLGLFINTALIWWSTALFRAHFLRRHFADKLES